MKRETAQVIEFRINLVGDNVNASELAKPNAGDEDVSDEADGFVVDLCGDAGTPAEVIHDEVKKENARLRESSEELDAPKVVDIYLNQFLGEMRPDTRLSLIDIPGVNDVKNKSNYKKWVDENWSTFDCVVVVLDATQGVNTNDPLDLLKLAKMNEQIRSVPIIILLNKVDDPENQELKVLCLEIQEAVQDIFGVSDRVAALSEFFRTMRDGDIDDFPSPVVLPVSAQYALLYHSANGTQLGLEEFKGFPFPLVEKFGLDEVGKHKWNRLQSKEEKYERAYNELQDCGLFEDMLRSTNFDKFSEVLTSAICGCEVQTNWIIKQLLDKSAKEDPIKTLRVMVHKLKALGASTASTAKLPIFFWKEYSEREDKAFEALTGPETVSCLASPMSLLVEYHGFAKEKYWHTETEAVAEKIVSLVHRQLSFLIEKLFGKQSVGKAESWDYMELPSALTMNINVHAISWEAVSLDNWTAILDSVLLVSHYKWFCETFGVEIIAMQRVIQTIERTIACKAMQWGEPTSGRGYYNRTEVTVTRALTDPKHWGHIIWSACRFATELEDAESCMESATNASGE